MIGEKRAQMALGWKGGAIATHAKPGNPFTKLLAAVCKLVLGF